MDRDARRVPGASSSSRAQPLNHNHIAQARLASPDDGKTLDLSHKSLGEVGESGAEELARIGAGEPGSKCSITRSVLSSVGALPIALGYNHLSTLPKAFVLLARLRYLNLRVNSFTVFPLVLTTLPSLEILDISRNKLKQLPEKPGNLVNLRVFSLGKNRLERLPLYLVDFKKLKVFKVESNPIQWPPKAVLERFTLNDTDEGMEMWISEVRKWIADHTPVESRDDDTLRRISEAVRSSVAASRNGVPSVVEKEPHVEEDAFAKHLNSLQAQKNPELSAPSHFRFPSTDSVSSYGSEGSVSGNRHGRTWSVSSSPPRSGSEEASSTDRDEIVFIPQDATVTLSSVQHGRNASYSPGGPSSIYGGNIAAKKSLPDLRASSRKPALKTTIPERPTFSPSRLDKQALPVSSPSSESAPSMDIERNSYFRRHSTLPASTISKSVPLAFLHVADATRGILFALSQIYTAVRNYTACTIDDRLSSTLGKVLEPASTYMGQLIDALDRFDSQSRRGMPPAHVCRGLLESCRDNVSVFGKVVSVLQMHLRVLTNSHDPRYARTLLLMLYGSVAEVSNSWRAMVPHIEAVQPFLRDQHKAPFSSLGRHAHGGSRGEKPGSADGHLPPASRFQVTTPQAGVARTSRRHAGSFSLKDVQIGKKLPSVLSSFAEPPSSSSSSTPQPPPAPLLSTSLPNSHAPLRSVLRNGGAHTTNGSPSSPGRAHQSTQSRELPPGHRKGHSRVLSQSASLMNLRYASSPMSGATSAATPTPNPMTPPMSNASSSPFATRTNQSPPDHHPPKDPDKVVDQVLLNSIEAAVDAGELVWPELENILGNGAIGAKGSDMRSALSRAQNATVRLRETMQSVQEDKLLPDKRTLGEDAHSFVMSVIGVSKLLKDLSATQPLLPAFRTNVARLTHDTKNLTIFLRVSSFSPSPTPTARPFSPSHSIIEERRPPMPLRTRSATVTSATHVRLQPPTPRDVVPWTPV
ncbi:hypothetical protein BOTBODRAFT_171740 [Botryobasidium botryosum FD-172 SS1]|uniref:RAM signaling network component n=1 Tax=Botryobasidium botryosum (strain FD-172 SS1) TaxID=930990 RepID=A0A067MTL4_BOTB1|nr:hypothetical protein BOTBODRAFT_171740 [Botryobasidium botryosum FD-172 SS1]